MCRALASSAEVEKQVKAIIARGSDDPMFLGALKWATEHGYGRAVQPVAPSGDLSWADIIHGLASKPAADDER